MKKDFLEHYKIGQKIKQIRKNCNISQKQLARSLEISFQQLQKYESGENRITTNKLWKISKLLKVKIEIFFQ